MKAKLLAPGAFIIGLLMTAAATERFVPQGGTLNYPNIQAAISASTSGDIVRVQPGVYRESITFRKIDITLTSLDPTDSNVVGSTVIQGDGTNSVVSFAGGQTTNALLTGFTIRGGGGTPLTADVLHFLFGGGIYCDQSSPSIVGNVIEDNRLATNLTTIITSGGGIACLGGSPRIARNVFRNNSASTGGAIHSDSGAPLIQDNWIYSNVAVVGGGALLVDHGQFINNTLSANTDDNLDVELTALVMNNIIALARPGIGVVVGPRAEDISKWFLFNDTWGNEGGEVLRFPEVGSRGSRLSAGVPILIAGANGNVSVDPRFASPLDFDFHLAADSPCINAGNPLGMRSADEMDIDGAPRVFALRVDLGAAERHGIGSYPPLANAGSNRTVDWNQGESVVLDGSASIDANGTPLRFAWRQVAGPQVALTVTDPLASFAPAALGEYRFELVVDNGVYASTPNAVQILVTNLPPIASAGFGRSLPIVPDTVVLDGSHSLDPEGQPLTYQWRQITGSTVQWTNTNPESARSAFRPPGSGAYEIELVVGDAFQSSLPDRVTFYLGPVPPVANAGLTRYAGRKGVTLDGSGSFAPNNPAPLEYAWRQLTGPYLALEKTNTAFPVIQGFQQLANQTQEAIFELVVRAGDRTSAPDTVKVVIVPAWKNSPLSLINPPFNPRKPTVIGFSGGNCDSGDAQSFPSSWRPLANLFTMPYSRDASSSSQAPVYFGYGDQLITILSESAPAYDQPIQTMGWSTGNMPACDVAERLNTDYRDPRYLVNRITLLDTGCNLERYSTNIAHLLANRVLGKSFWIENYYSASRQFRPGTLNIEFPVPPADHATPHDWYFPSWNMASTSRLTNFNSGIFGGAFFSVVGPGRNYQLETGQADYYFGWPTAKSASFPLNKLVQISPITCPARLPGPVQLLGPDDGESTRPGNVIFSCQPVLNAVRYQILIGPAARQLDWVAWEGTAPPYVAMSELPFATTYWTVRAADAYGTTSQADPRFVYRDSDGDGLSDEMEVFVYHTDPDKADTDEDGHPDGQEMLAGTDPLSPFDGFHFGCRALANDQLAFSWFADPAKIYSLEFSQTLSSPSWRPVETITTSAVGGFIQHIVSKPQSAFGFYRLHVGIQ